MHLCSSTPSPHRLQALQVGLMHFRLFNQLPDSNFQAVPLSSIPKGELGHSILLTRENQPPGASKTPHEVIATGVFAAKILSLSSSVAGAVMVPVLSNYLWDAASERPTIALFAGVANVILVLLSLTPLLLHFLAKRFPLNIYYHHDSKTFTTTHYNFLMRKMALRFKSDDVVDAAKNPQLKKVFLLDVNFHTRRFEMLKSDLFFSLLLFYFFQIWIPLATAFVGKRPLLISLDKRAYIDQLAFEELTKNIDIPPGHD
ncbi:hypothetical protein WR25_17347 isoform C [Diploscapter pachys]|uniref:Uncharacterized protein n=1 Tax=Diploscapter pachys TaxID=2018661 RepID=A0A2A2JN52_9BILA|nr:hypothetical protein WR25_17347 isoform C [Diploscapter pachys]